MKELIWGGKSTISLRLQCWKSPTKRPFYGILDTLKTLCSLSDGYWRFVLSYCFIITVAFYRWVGEKFIGYKSFLSRNVSVKAINTYSKEQSPSLKLTGFQLVKKFPAFYGIRRFITSFITARHLSLSWATSIQSILPQSTSYRSILILSSHLRLGLPSSLFPSGFPTKTLNASLISLMRAAIPAHLILLDSWGARFVKFVIMQLRQ